jgi:hypothetical protein
MLISAEAKWAPAGSASADAAVEFLTDDADRIVATGDAAGIAAADCMARVGAAKDLAVGMAAPPARTGAVELPLQRTSDLLRGILTKNPSVKTFTVQRILSSIGFDSVEASLMVLSLPAIVPVPVTGGRTRTALEIGVIGGQMAAGRGRVKLPAFLLKKSISRRALAVAIHAVLPVLERAQKKLRPRWSWVDHANVRRAIGLFILLLALALAQPFFGIQALHAVSIFVMSLGMAEKDGLAVLAGVAVGLLSLALVAASGISAKAARSKVAAWLRKAVRRIGASGVSALLEKHGYDRLAKVSALQWSDFLLLWNPDPARPPSPPNRSGASLRKSRRASA